MVRFPVSIDLSSPEIYFSIFNAPYWMTKDRELQLARDTRNPGNILNDFELIRKIAIEDFGIIIEKNNNYFTATAFLSSEKISSISLLDRAGWVYNNFFKKTTKNSGTYYCVLNRSEISILNGNIFKNSSKKNGIYNIISIFILVLARDAGIYPEITEEAKNEFNESNRKWGKRKRTWNRR